MTALPLPPEFDAETVQALAAAIEEMLTDRAIRGPLHADGQAIEQWVDEFHIGAGRLREACRLSDRVRRDHAIAEGLDRIAARALAASASVRRRGALVLADFPPIGAAL